MFFDEIRRSFTHLIHKEAEEAGQTMGKILTEVSLKSYNTRGVIQKCEQKSVWELFRNTLEQLNVVQNN